MDRYDAVSPLDYRYYGGNERIFAKVRPILSERANIRYCLLVEVALVRGFEAHRLCPVGTAEEVARAAMDVTAEEVYEEDSNIHHYTKAIVNCLARRVSANARPFVHLFLTSYDTMDTAMSLKFRDFTKNVVLPDLCHLEEILIALARAGAVVPQIGRTHGQHAVPITFGLYVATIVGRLGLRIQTISRYANELRGSLSGAVGAYNAMALAFPDPMAFEEEVLRELGLKASHNSSQIVEPEPLTDLTYALVSCFGVIANLADDMRHLQRTEIGEVQEAFTSQQVGSSTMPHKRNPWNFEHVKSMWKEFMPRLVSVLANQISEHQRDLTNSASGRFLAELYVGFTDALDRSIELCEHIEFNKEAMRRNLALSKAFIAEPLYITLALLGFQDAHEYVKKLAMRAISQDMQLIDLALNDDSLKPYFVAMTDEQRAAISQPERYVGIATEKTYAICDYWESTLCLNEQQSASHQNTTALTH